MARHSPAIKVYPGSIQAVHYEVVFAHATQFESQGRQVLLVVTPSPATNILPTLQEVQLSTKFSHVKQSVEQVSQWSLMMTSAAVSHSVQMFGFGSHFLQDEWQLKH